MAPGATRNARGASGRTWSRGRGVVEGNPPTLSVSPERVYFSGINGSSSSSSSDDNRISSDSSTNNDSGDLPALVGRPARNLKVFGELPALQSGRTRSQSQGLAISASYADVLLVYTMRTIEAKMIVKEETAENERAHDSLLEERLEKEREWPEELKRRGALLEQREEEHDSDCPLAMVVEQQPKLSIPSLIRSKTSEVESPPIYCSRCRTVCLPEELGTGHAIRVRGAHENGNLLHGRQGTGGT